MCSNTLTAILCGATAGLCLLMLGAPEWAGIVMAGVVVWAVLRGAT